MVFGARAARAQVVPSSPETLSIGDWQLAPVVEVRVRGEYRHDLDAVERVIAVERARLGLDLTHGPLEARVVVQDARALDLTVGDSFVGGSPVQALTGAYEAWVEAHTSSVHPSFVRVGRQPITWGEGRLLGEADWSPSGRSLDAVRARLAIDAVAVEALAATVDAPSRNFFATEVYATLLGARFQWALDPLFAVELYGLARLGYYNPPAAMSFNGAVQGQTLTGAARLHGERSSWTWGVEGAYQFGRTDRVARPGGLYFTGRRAAWAAAAHVSRTFDGAVWTPTLGIGAAYATGDDGGKTYRAFDPLLPDVHTWHGMMDLFAWSNEEEVSARLSAVPWNDGLVGVEYRYARMPQPGGDAWRSGYLVTIGSAQGNTSAALGHEVDAWLRWAPWTNVSLDGGYSAFFVGAGARAILTADAFPEVTHVAHFAYLQARYAF
ncbi:MAG: alginate export family protein [Polyangiaceae bacterium]|nr:alginate export family protein [Polyangiaceae bacterium]